MVNLSTISKDTYKELGFKNKSKAIAFIKGVLQTKVTKYKTAEQLTNHIKPKLSNLTSLGMDINDKGLYNNLKAIKKSEKIIKKMDKNLNKVDQGKIDNIINKWDKEFNTKTWHISGKVKIKEIYHKQNDYQNNYLFDNGETNVVVTKKRNKEYTYVKDRIDSTVDKLSKNQEETDSIIFKGTREEAIEAFKDEMFIKFERIDPSPDVEYKVEGMEITSIVEVSNTATKQADMPMKNASQLIYNCIDEYKDYLQNNGTCAIDNFIGMYGKELNITREQFIEMCNDYYKQLNMNWSPEYGVTPRCINSICEKYDITHYAFDVNKSCFIKHMSTNRNHKALIYFAVNNHMYLILDKVMRKSLVEKVKVKENFNTSMLDNDDNEKENIFDTYKIIVNPTSFFNEDKHTIYMYSRPGKTNINDVFQQLIQVHGVPKDLRCKKTKIVSFKYVKNNINYVFACDPNDIHNMSFREVKVLCEKNSLPFKNQTFMQVVKQLRTRFFDEINGRIHFTKELVVCKCISTQSVKVFVK